ncbi:MAG: hypothetical protein V7L04_03535, partial [Nostoc sp.]|uniref:hypothetical protein n=1 Tax=Nostoc sp. TaxID=1180 RepID=UPI002FFAB893
KHSTHQLLLLLQVGVLFWMLYLYQAFRELVLRIDRHNQMWITSRYKALPCNALVGGLLPPVKLGGSSPPSHTSTSLSAETSVERF